MSDGEGVVDWCGDAAHAYAAGRALEPETIALWRDVFARYAGTDHRIAVDLGGGTGRFVPALRTLADTVVALDPSVDMLRYALRAAPVRGVAEALPFRAGAIDVCLLSMILHYVDQAVVARELARALRPGGVVLVRNSFAGHLGHIRMYEFFPEARRIDELRLPQVHETVQTFASAGLHQIGHEYVDHTIDRDLHAHHDRLSLRATSQLRIMSDEAFERGLAALKEAAESEPTAPVIERFDLLAFRRP